LKKKLANLTELRFGSKAKDFTKRETVEALRKSKDGKLLETVVKTWEGEIFRNQGRRRNWT
jgi:hypothetical protein